MEETADVFKRPFFVSSFDRNFSIFKMVTILQLGFLKQKFVTATHFQYMFCIILPNFMEIDHTEIEIL